MTGETSCRAVARQSVALHLSRHMGPQAFRPFRSPVPQCSSTHFRAFSWTFNLFAQSSDGQHFLLAPLPSQVTAPFPPRWQNAASARGSSSIHGTARRVVARAVKMSRRSGFMLRLYGSRGDTSLHRCDSTPAWELPYRSIGAVDAQAARGSIDIIIEFC